MTSAATHICYLNSTQVIPIQFLLIKSMLEETVGAPYPNSFALALGSLVVSTVTISQVLVQNNLDRGRPLSLLTYFV